MMINKSAADRSISLKLGINIDWL